MSKESTAEPGYKIGTVAGLTGLDPHTIRAWERRYSAVKPMRGPRGMRRYDDAAVMRLQLLKAVTDCGDAIGAVASLPDTALRERLGRLAAMAADGAGSPASGPSAIAVLGPALYSQLGVEATSMGSLRMSVSAGEFAPFLEKLSDASPDVVVVELRALGPEPLRRLEEIQDACDPRLMLVVYDFARGTELALLSRIGARVVRGPMRLAQLRQVIDDFSVIEATAPRRRTRLVPNEPLAETPRAFDDHQLARLMEMQSAVQCECPSHVASLVSSVLGFERYSNDCENRSPEDAALHRYLASASSRVRHELEVMLQRVCEHEGIRI